MSRPINSSDGLSQRNRVLMNALMGFTIGNFEIDFEYDSLIDPSKNTLTSLDGSDLEAAGIGTLAQLTYSVSEKFKTSLRAEHLENDPGKQGIANLDSASLAFNYSINEELMFRSEWIHYRAYAINQDRWSDSRYIFSVLASL